MSKAERKERAKKRKRQKRTRTLVIAVSIFLTVDLLFALGFWLGLRTTGRVTEENSHTITAVLEDVHIDRARRHRSLRFSANGEDFYLHANIFYYDVDQIAQELQGATQDVNVIVLDDTFSLWGRRTPAGIYDSETVYLDIADFNRYQAKERAALYILAAVFGGILILCHVGGCIFWRLARNKEK